MDLPARRKFFVCGDFPSAQHLGCRSHAMIRKNKWIEIHSPHERVALVAARTLEGRLRLVRHYLPLASAAADDNDEHVHQTRVATRRAMTTLSIFDSLMPRRKARWFRKSLKRVRRALNDARDYDVLAERLDQRPHESKVEPAYGELMEWIHDRRREAQQPIRRIAAKLVRKGFKRRAKRLVQALESRRRKRKAAQTFGQFAQVRMQRLIDEFFAYEPHQLRDLAKLHEFRVSAKHLRYAMEVFAGAFGRSFREVLYPQVEALQERLGRISDHATARQHFERWLADSKQESRSALLRELIEEERAAIFALQAQFLSEWTIERATGLHRQFLAELPDDCRPPATAVG